MQTLRPYQNEANFGIYKGINDGFTKLLFTLATGCGKTSCVAEQVRVFDMRGWKVLCLAHRFELVQQMHGRIRSHCDFDDFQIGFLTGNVKRVSQNNCCIVGTMQTVVSENSLPTNFIPNVIIIDEAHRSPSATYRKICKRFHVGEPGGAVLIGCTATARRTDKQSLFALHPDGSPVYIYDKKQKKKVQADAATSVFQKHVYDFNLSDAIDGGYLVPIKGHIVQTETDLSSVETDTDGDFKDAQLQKAVDNAERTLAAISAWKEIAEGRPTIVFCSGVEHAEHAAELWRQAGYKAASLNGGTDATERATTIAKFLSGQLQVLCNMGLFTEGTDFPNAACVVHLRPTKSWNLYVQMTGRGSRTLTGVIDGIETPEARKTAIAASAKPDCIILDLVDICEGQDLCAAPSLLDLPANLDLQGESVTEAKQLREDYEEAQGQIIGECPVTFRELKARVEEVQLIRNSIAKTKDIWKVTPDGFRFAPTQLGYQVEVQSPEPGKYHMRVKRGQEEIYKTPLPEMPFEKVLDYSAYFADIKISEDAARRRAAAPAKQPSGGTQISEKQRYVLTNRIGFSHEQVDAMPYKQARAILDQHFDKLPSRQEAVSAPSGSFAA